MTPEMGTSEIVMYVSLKVSYPTRSLQRVLDCYRIFEYSVGAHPHAIFSSPHHILFFDPTHTPCPTTYYIQTLMAM